MTDELVRAYTVWAENHGIVAEDGLVRIFCEYKTEIRRRTRDAMDRSRRRGVLLSHFPPKVASEPETIDAAVPAFMSLVGFLDDLDRAVSKHAGKARFERRSAAIS